MLVDAGAGYYRYTADITCTFPVGGKFSPLQRLVYEAVLAANRAVIAAMRPGVSWLVRALPARGVHMMQRNWPAPAPALLACCTLAGARSPLAWVHPANPA